MIGAHLRRALAARFVPGQLQDSADVAGRQERARQFLRGLLRLLLSDHRYRVDGETPQRLTRAARLDLVQAEQQVTGPDPGLARCLGMGVCVRKRILSGGCEGVDGVGARQRRTHHVDQRPLHLGLRQRPCASRTQVTQRRDREAG